MARKIVTNSFNNENDNINQNHSNLEESFENEPSEVNIREVLQAILRRRKWFFITTGILFTGVILSTVHARIFNPVFRGSFSLLIVDPMNPANNKNNRAGDYDSLFENIALNSDTYETETLLTLLKSPLFLKPIAKDFDLSLKDLTSIISIDQESTKRNAIANGILNVRIELNSKEKGKLLLESLADSYLQASLKRRQKKLRDGLEFLNTQAPEIYKKRNELQTKLVAFREKNKLIAPLVEGGVLKSQQKEIDLLILDLKAEKNNLEDIRKEIKNGTLTARGFQEVIGNGLSISDFDQSLLQQIITVESELAEARSKYTSSSTIVEGLRSRLDQIQPKLLDAQLEAVDTVLNLNTGRLETALEQKREIEEKFLKQPVLIKQYRNIEQEIEIANQNLLSLVSARENFQLEMAQSTIPWTVISSPNMEKTPIRPNIKRNIAVGFFGGIFLGSIIALIRDRFDHVFHHPNEVRENINLPLLGHIPYVDFFKNVRQEKTNIIDFLTSDSDSKDNSKEDIYQKFLYQEALRNLYTSIRFLKTDNQVKTLALTSSMPNEGKSLINILLAKTLADIGERVLLIDSDLRKSQIHLRLGINNLLGLSNLLADSTINIDQAIQQVPGHKNWDVITGGTLPPDPTRLLNSNRLRNIIDDFKKSEKYDMILFDCPPVLGLADALLVADKVDGAIIVIGLGVADRAMPKESFKRLTSSGINLFGAVTNSTQKESNTSESTYGYGGYGVYGAGYGNLYASYALDQEGNKKELNQNNSSEIEVESKNNFDIESLNNKFRNLIKYVTNWLDS